MHIIIVEDTTSTIVMVEFLTMKNMHTYNCCCDTTDVHNGDDYFAIYLRHQIRTDVTIVLPIASSQYIMVSSNMWLSHVLVFK